MGAIHPEVAENFDCPTDTYIAVLDVASIIERADMIRAISLCRNIPLLKGILQSWLKKMFRQGILMRYSKRTAEISLRKSDF